MPDLEPVFGDPFATRMQPVGGDPFASMTHWPDQPAQPYMHPNVPATASAIAGFASGGLQGAGAPLPDWAASNPIQRALQNPDNIAAAGMARPVGALSARGQLGKFELSDLHKDFQAGLNNRQIADKYNVTKEAIQQRRTQMGYPQKPRGRPWPSRLEPVSHDPFAEESEPLQREVISRGRSGRPIQTAPLPIGNENAVLEAGAALNEPQPHPGWISTRLPTGAKATENPFIDRLIIDPEAMKNSPKTPQQSQTLWDKNVGLTRDYPNLSPAEKRTSSTDVLAERFIEHVKSNLNYIYDNIPEAIRQRSKLWYDGANKIAQYRADQYGMTLPQSSAVYAALSPQKDWFQNVSLGDRVMHIYHTQQETGWTPEMTGKAQSVITNQKGQVSEDLSKILDLIHGKSLGELPSADEKALWIRIYDESHHDPSFHVISPEGDYMHLATNKPTKAQERAGQPGNNTRVAWGGLSEIGKAIGAIESKGDIPTISKFMGEKHKVRNFYNNILDPNGPMGDVTIDTHAVAAGLLRPLSGKSLEVAHNFENYPGKGLPSASGSNFSGAKGTYGLYAEAYRRAAAEYGILPRELQSITWEGVRGLFPEEFKTEANMKAIDSIWDKRAKGASLAKIRGQVHDFAGGFRPPEWWTGE